MRARFAGPARWLVEPGLGEVHGALMPRLPVELALVHVDEEVRELALAIALLAHRPAHALVELLERQAEDEIERRGAVALHGCSLVCR